MNAYQCPSSCVGEHTAECDRAFQELSAEQTRRREVQLLCYGYNDATSPSVFRTEDEHERCRQRAREIRLALRSKFREGADYRETESGRFLPVL